jgi:nitroreductase
VGTLSDLLDNRRSTRRFDPDREIPAELLERVLQAPLGMPHAGNTYDWRAIVLPRRTRRADTWPKLYEALFSQRYVDEAAVVVVWAVQPAWWAANYRRNIADLVERRLLDTARAGELLEMVNTGPEAEFSLPTALAGEAMMGVAAAMLVAIESGLGATVTACRPRIVATALGLPAEAVVLPFGVLALGYPADAPAGRPAKPTLRDVYYLDRWGEPLDLTGR